METAEALLTYFRQQWEEKRGAGIGHTAQLWDRRAQDWAQGLAEEGAMRRVTAIRIREAVRFLAENGCLTPEQEVIDIGCGPGRFVAEFARQARWVTGVDLSPSMTRLGEIHCQEAGLKNVSFAVRDFKETTVGEMGWEKKFDLVYSSMTPAMSAFSSLEKMIQMSRAYCCNSCCVLSQSTLEKALQEALGAENVQPAWDGQWFYTLVNLVWLMGYFPRTDYFPVEYTENRVITMDFVREALRRRCRKRDLDEAFVKRGYDCLMARARDGVFAEQCANWYGAVLWDVRVKTPRR